MKIIPFNLPEPASARATAFQDRNSARALEAPELPSVRVVVAFPKPKFAARATAKPIRTPAAGKTASVRVAPAQLADVILLHL